MKPQCSYTQCYNVAIKHGRCGTHLPQKRLLEYTYSPVPMNAKVHMGVEIECFGRDRQTLLNYAEYNATSDGSIGGGCEFKLLHYATIMPSKASNFVAELRQIGGYVTASCGLHVHLDSRKIKDRNKCIQWLKDTESYWFSLMPYSRRENAYCKTLREASPNDHYAWANIQHDNTIEIRLHGGTLNPYKMRGWLLAMKDLQSVFIADTQPVVNRQYPVDAVYSVITNPVAQKYLQDRYNAGGTLNTYSSQNEMEEDL